VRKKCLKVKRRQQIFLRRLIAGSAVVLVLVVCLRLTPSGKQLHFNPIFHRDFPPLVMYGEIPISAL